MLTATTGSLDVYTTLDIHLQRIAQDALRDGLARVDELLAKKKRAVKSQGALIAIDPRTGEVLALVGGRSYNQSQYNRAISASRQTGSVFKPFVYLAAFERAAAEGRNDLTPATLVDDSPTTFTTGADEDWTPNNYENEYDGIITLRRALALSRNVATIKVAETAGFDKVAALWEQDRRRHERARVPVDHAGRVRGDAVRDRHRVHAVSQRRADPPAPRARHASSRAARRSCRRICRRRRSRAPTRRTSSST